MKKEKIKLVDLSDYIARTGDFYVNTYYLSWFELLRYHEEKFVWFGVGQWSSHMMDWRGCNYWHSRLPKSPIFADAKEAIDWLYYQVENGIYKNGMELSGHHAGENRCKVCNKPETEMTSFWDRRETNVIIFHHEINGTRKQRKSRLRFYKDNERELI